MQEEFKQNLWQRYGAFLVEALSLVKMSSLDCDRLKVYDVKEAITPQENELFIRLDTAAMDEMETSGKIYMILRGLSELHQDEAMQDLEVPGSEEEMKMAQNKMIYLAMRRGGYPMNQILEDLVKSSNLVDVFQYVCFLATNPIVQRQDAAIARRFLPKLSWVSKESLAEELGGKQLRRKWLFSKLCKGLNQVLKTDILFLDMPVQIIEQMAQQAAKESPNSQAEQNFFFSHYQGADVVFLSYSQLADQFYSDDQIGLNLARQVVAHKSKLPEQEQVKMVLAAFQGSPLSALKGLDDMGDQVSLQDLKLFLETVLTEDPLYRKSEERELITLSRRFNRLFKVKKAEQPPISRPNTRENN